MEQSHDTHDGHFIWRPYRSHPWHGIAIGADAPRVVAAYIELVPTDTVKFELDKASGFLIIDRPQRFSNICPTPYGMIPQTLCAGRVAELCARRTGHTGIVGDGDPLDICVLVEKTIGHGDILLRALPIGGLRMIDGEQADDKIIAVMQGDSLYSGWGDVGDLPGRVVERLKHYFLTYKQSPESTQRRVEITHVYDRDEAYEVIDRSREDYQRAFGDHPGGPP